MWKSKFFEVSKFSVANITDMEYMFGFSKKINSLDLSKLNNSKVINPLASPGAGAPTLKYGYVNTVTTSPCEVKGLII